MKQQLKLLEELQQHDARLMEYETGLKALPEKLASLKGDLAKMEALLEKERQAFADTEKWRRDQEMQLKIDEAAAAKAKTKLNAVKTGKDYMAAQREVESNRRAIAEREEEIVKMLEVVESSKKRIEQHEADVAALREVVAKEEAEITARIEELRVKAEGERGAREQAAAKVDANVLKRYSSIRMRRGLAVVPVVGGTCKGCHMAIPPQLFITLQRMNSLETCPACARIIYWDEMMKEERLEQGESGDPQPSS